MTPRSNQADLDADLDADGPPSPVEISIASALPDLRLPARLLQQLAAAVADEDVQLLAGDVRGLGFGAYAGQLCLVTPTRVLLATATSVGQPDAAFGIEEWDRSVAPLPRFVPVAPRTAVHDHA